MKVSTIDLKLGTTICTKRMLTTENSFSVNGYLLRFGVKFITLINFVVSSQQNELFDKARNEILDEVLTLSEITPQMWEETITKHLWAAVASHFIETIYLPAAQAANPSNFNTAVDIKLKQWAERTLPDISVKVLLSSLGVI